VFFSDINYRPINVDPNTGQTIYWESIANKLAGLMLTAEDTYDMALELVGLMEHRRVEAREQNKTRFKPVFFLIEELPALLSKMEEIGVPLSNLLRESRQWNIFVVCTMQDALCKTMKLDNGILSNFKTAVYTGGEMVTAKKVLNLASKGKLVDSDKIGKDGLVYLKTHNIAASLCTIPYSDNEATFQLLGSPNDKAVPDLPDFETMRYER